MAILNPNMLQSVAYLGGSPTFRESMPGAVGNPIGDDWFSQNAPTSGFANDGTNPMGREFGPSANTGIAGGGGMPNANQWDQSTFTQQFGTPGTPQELAALEPQLNAAGIRVSRNASGVAGKIILPNGQYVDVINSAGAGGKGFQWLTGDGGGAGSAAGGGYNFATDDPSYQWRLDQGLQGVQKSAAARGNLLTGGTLKDLMSFGQGLASTEYQNAFNRKYGLAGLGLNAANIGANSGSSYGANSANLATGQGNANAASTIAQGKNNASTIGDLFKVGADLYGKWKAGQGGGGSYITDDVNGVQNRIY